MSRRHSPAVACLNCFAPTRAGTATGLCRKCWQLTNPGSALKYPWNKVLDDTLREAYNRCVLGKPTVAIDALCKITGYPRAIVRLRAQRLGLTRDTRRPWTLREIAYLRQMAGHATTKQIALDLKRSWASVQARMDREALGRKVTDGYTAEQLAALLGIEPVTVRKHIVAGRLRVNSARRVTDASVLTLFRTFLGHVDLRLCDQAWLKSQLSRLMVPVVLAPSADTRRYA